MVSIRNNKQLKYFKEWVENTQDTDLPEYFHNHILKKLKELRMQEGRCNQRSLVLTKGKYKGSCMWRGWKNAYEICLRWGNTRITYGFFSNLYAAELELQLLFKEDESNLVDKARKQQKYYQIQNRLTMRPKLTDNTLHIQMITNSKQKLILRFKEFFINPITKKKQKSINWGDVWFKYFDKRHIIKECVRLDDPIEIINYREQLKPILKEQQQKEKQQEKGENKDVYHKSEE